MIDDTIIQCCYCKANSENHPNLKFYNVQNGKKYNIAHGCGLCKAYADKLKTYETKEH